MTKVRLIDADALKNDLCDFCTAQNEEMEGCDHCMTLDIIDQQPTVDAEPVRHGRWIPVTNGRGGYECDQCRNYAPSYQTGKEHLSDYCPHCGARMDGGADNG